MGGNTPKQFLLINNKPVLYYTLQTFLNAFADIQIILVLPVDYTDMGQEIIDAYFDNDRIKVSAGGDTRFQSVKSGLQLVEDDSIIFVHDGVRCLVSVPLIRRCYNQALEKGSAVPAVAATDSIRIVKNGTHYVKDRQQVRIVQTPQTFVSTILIPAFEQEFNESFTDEATVVEASGKEIFLTEGEYDNIKITRPVDLLIAERIIEDRSAL